jgi:hypothetical protein
LKIKFNRQHNDHKRGEIIEMEEGAEYRKLYDEGIIDKVLDKVEPTEAIRRDL